VLTIIGYSINDKIVIDDRIRENMRRYRKMDMREIIDLSVNETLPRTVMTSLTILLALVSLLIFGGHVLRGFHRGDDPGRHRRHLFVNLCVVVAVDHAWPARRACTRKAERDRGSRTDRAERGALMRLTREAGGQGPLISGFSGGGFRIDDKVFLTLLITPNSAASWAPPPIEALDAPALAPLFALDPPPEFILIGTGPALVRPPRALIEAIEAKGIGVELMDSRAAARAWGLLRGEDRWIAGAFYPVSG